MQKIYIVLTYTGTMLSRIIKGFTGAKYAHVSIALDKELQQMYSFGRLNPYNPFIGGFVHERINRGTFKRFYKTQSKILEIEVTDEQYEALKYNIKQFRIDRRLYKFNTIGLFAAGFNIKMTKERSFYCAEFVKYVLEMSKIDVELPNIIKPENFQIIENKEGCSEVYRGKLKEYSKKFKVKRITQSI